MLFDEIKIGRETLKNRIIRAATYEGMCDKSGYPKGEYVSMYERLSKSGAAGIITGFVYISKQGRSMQGGQAGIDHDDKIEHYKKVTEAVHENNCKIYMQIAHTGRQTREIDTNEKVVSASSKKSFYFKSDPKELATGEVYRIVNDFVSAAIRAKEAGFDGIQIHAAHGYLIHQFILTSLNNRKDEFGIEKNIKIGTRFLGLIIDGIREKCGEEFALIVKVSGSDDYINKFSESQFKNLIEFLDYKKVDAIEISYGTMDYALNIFRGEIPVDTILNVNPVYRRTNIFSRMMWKIFFYPIMKQKIKKFTYNYNLNFCKIAKQITNIPIICVGGVRKAEDMENMIANSEADLISLCRPFICEDDIVEKIKLNNKYVSKCINCNLCSVMCDSGNQTRCYNKKGEK